MLRNDIELREVIISLSLLALTSFGVSVGCYAENNIDTGDAGTYIYPEVDEELAVSILKVRARPNEDLINYENLHGLTWDEVDGKAIEAYSFNGTEKWYLTYIYLGEGKLPNEAELEKEAEYIYGLKKEYINNSQQDPSFARSIEGKALRDKYDKATRYPAKNPTGVFISVAIWAGPPDGPIGSPCLTSYGFLPFWIQNKPEALEKVKALSGNDNCYVDGYIIQWSASVNLCYKIKTNDGFYYVSCDNPDSYVFTEEEFDRRFSDLWKPYDQPKMFGPDRKNNLDIRKREYEEIEGYKRDEDYISKWTINGKDSFGINVFSDAYEKATHVPDYTQGSWGCSNKAFAAMIAYEMWYTKEYQGWSVIGAWNLLPLGQYDENEYTDDDSFGSDAGHLLGYIKDYSHNVDGYFGVTYGTGDWIGVGYTVWVGGEYP